MSAWQETKLYWFLWNWRYRLIHPRDALCDWGIWKCSRHDRMLWLASERRWAIRHKIRARRIRKLGWGRSWSAQELAILRGDPLALRDAAR